MRQILLLSLVLPLAACTPYRSAAIEGTVVDTRAGPLEGAVVVAHWQVRGGLMDQRPIKTLRIMETVTDSKGRYVFPAWGPVPVVGGEVRDSEPSLLAFKPGYAPTTSLLYLASKSILALDRIEAPPRQHAERLAELNRSLIHAGYDNGEESGDYCAWKQFPRMLHALDELDPGFAAANADRGIIGFLKANEKRLKEVGCGSLSDLLAQRRK